MKHDIAAEDREETGATNGRSMTDRCPVSDLPVLEDTDPTMPVLALTEDKTEDYGYDPYDTGSFWSTK